MASAMDRLAATSTALAATHAEPGKPPDAATAGLISPDTPTSHAMQAQSPTSKRVSPTSKRVRSEETTSGSHACAKQPRTGTEPPLPEQLRGHSIPPPHAEAEQEADETTMPLSAELSKAELQRRCEAADDDGCGSAGRCKRTAAQSKVNRFCCDQK